MKKFKIVCLLLLVPYLPLLALQDSSEVLNPGDTSKIMQKLIKVQDQMQKVQDQMQKDITEIKKFIAEINAKTKDSVQIFKNSIKEKEKSINILTAEKNQYDKRLNDTIKSFNDIIKNLELNNTSLKEKTEREIMAYQSQINDYKSQVSNYKKEQDQMKKDYGSMATSIIKNGSIIPNELLEILLKEITPNDKLKEFQKQSIDLKFVQDLLNKSQISEQEYTRAKDVMSKDINKEFPEQAKLYSSIKANWDLFNISGKDLSDLLTKIKDASDPNYRKDKIDYDFPSKKGCLLFPYLNQKLNEAYKNSNTKIDFKIP
jgi:DNA repair exonuclease SbcCD ATPase subunit